MTHGEKPSGESTIYGDESVFVEELLPGARKRLVTIRHDASLREAAALLLPGTDLIVVCGVGGAMVGVITKSDVVARIGHCEGAACTIAVHLVLSANVLQCMPRDRVQDVWSKMKEQGSRTFRLLVPRAFRSACSTPAICLAFFCRGSSTRSRYCAIT